MVNAVERKLTAIAVTETPCGMCRQVMREFCDPKTFKVIVAKSAEDCWVFTLDDTRLSSYLAGPAFDIILPLSCVQLGGA